MSPRRPFLQALADKPIVFSVAPVVVAGCVAPLESGVVHCRLTGSVPVKP